MSWQDEAGRDLVRSFGERMAMFVRGEGAYLWDDAGRRYLDFLGGIAVNSLGHAHPVFVEAVARQAATLTHVSNYFATPPQLQLAALELCAKQREPSSRTVSRCGWPLSLRAAGPAARSAGERSSSKPSM